MDQNLMRLEPAEIVNGSENLKKPFSVCQMVFTPYDVTNMIVGKTDEVLAYFNSMNNFDYVWYVFDSETDLEAGIKEIASKPTWYITWMRFEVKDLELGQLPKLAKGIDLGNPG